MAGQQPHFGFGPQFPGHRKQRELDWGPKGTVDAYAFFSSRYLGQGGTNFVCI